MASSPQPSPSFAAQNPTTQGSSQGAPGSGVGALSRVFGNLQISRGAAPPPTLAVRLGPPPSAARPAFPSSPPTPPFVWAPTPSTSTSLPFGGQRGVMSQPPHRSEGLQVRRLSRHRRSGVPRVVSQAPSPFGGPPTTASQASSPFVGHSVVASQGDVPRVEGTEGFAAAGVRA
jgi:protein transport protein SEC24